MPATVVAGSSPSSVCVYGSFAFSFDLRRRLVVCQLVQAVRRSNEERGGSYCQAVSLVAKGTRSTVTARRSVACSSVVKSCSSNRIRYWSDGEGRRIFFRG